MEQSMSYIFLEGSITFRAEEMYMVMAAGWSWLYGAP
jgi:hypothetical protein